MNSYNWNQRIALKLNIHHLATVQVGKCEQEFIPSSRFQPPCSTETSRRSTDRSRSGSFSSWASCLLRRWSSWRKSKVVCFRGFCVVVPHRRLRSHSDREVSSAVFETDFVLARIVIVIRHFSVGTVQSSTYAKLRQPVHGCQAAVKLRHDCNGVLANRGAAGGHGRSQYACLLHVWSCKNTSSVTSNDNPFLSAAKNWRMLWTMPSSRKIDSWDS